MKGLKFSLIQLVICVGLILIIAYFLISSAGNQQQTTPSVPQFPQATIPFQEIKMK